MIQLLWKIEKRAYASGFLPKGQEYSSFTVMNLDVLP